ncbi:MAG: D-alanyl-D-alanine carboxypeptidase, partial [Rhodobacteraceae bacterium]|nr:D-alanyl-D-alanine carboxypeptidase [Paracoccaceae bacterium]
MAPRLGDYVRRVVVLLALAVVAACGGPRESNAAPPYAAYVMDARTGETLYAENADTRLHPASLTKMMTLYIAFEEIERGRISLDDMVTVSANAAAQPPSRLGLKKGQKIQLRYLIRAAAVKSANDAASAIGDHIAGNQEKFAARMTRTAKALGMKNTTFKNANGLTASGHLSTARDMSVLGRHLFYDFPQYYNIFSRRATDAGLAEVANTNRRFLDKYPGADGIKTGYTVAAGFNLTASAERGGVRIIATVLGGKSTDHRNGKMADLLDLGFSKAKRNVKEVPPQIQAVPPADAELVAEADDGLPEGARLFAVWEKADGPGMVTFATPNTLSTQVQFDAPGRYRLRLTVTDTELAACHDLEIIVNQTPTAQAGPDGIATVGLPIQFHG